MPLPDKLNPYLQLFQIIIDMDPGPVWKKHKESKNSHVVVDHSKFFKFKGIMIIFLHFPINFGLLFFLVLNGMLVDI